MRKSPPPTPGGLVTGNGKLRASALGRDPGTCSAGPYAGHPEVCGRADTVVPVDLYVPGCQPHPVTLLDGLLRLPGRREGSVSSSRRRRAS